MLRFDAKPWLNVVLGYKPNLQLLWWKDSSPEQHKRNPCYVVCLLVVSGFPTQGCRWTNLQPCLSSWELNLFYLLIFWNALYKQKKKRRTGMLKRVGEKLKGCTKWVSVQLKKKVILCTKTACMLLLWVVLKVVMIFVILF